MYNILQHVSESALHTNSDYLPQERQLQHQEQFRSLTLVLLLTLSLISLRYFFLCEVPVQLPTAL